MRAIAGMDTTGWTIVGVIFIGNILAWVLSDIIRKYRAKKNQDTQLSLASSRDFFRRLIVRFGAIVGQLFIFVLGVTLIFYPLFLGRQAMRPRYDDTETVKKEFLSYLEEVKKSPDFPHGYYASDYFGRIDIDWASLTLTKSYLESFEKVEYLCGEIYHANAGFSFGSYWDYLVFSERALDEGRDRVEEEIEKIRAIQGSNSWYEMLLRNFLDFDSAKGFLANPHQPVKFSPIDMDTFYDKYNLLRSLGILGFNQRWEAVRNEDGEYVYNEDGSVVTKESYPKTLFWGLVDGIPDNLNIPQLSFREHIHDFFVGGDFGHCFSLTKEELLTFFEMAYGDYDDTENLKLAFHEARDDQYYLFFPSPSVASIMYNKLSDIYTVAVIFFAILLVLLVIYQYAIFTRQERKRARKQMEDVRNFTHDMKTPLAILWQYSDMINLENLPPAERELMGKIQGGLQDMARRVQGILEFMRQGAGSLNVSMFSLGYAAEDCLLEISPLLDDNGVTWTVAKEADTRIEADKSRIEQALRNFLSNAAKHTPKDGRVEVRITRPKKKSVRITVFNSGEDIPKSEQKKIWEMFYSLEGGGDNALRGTGIGLAAVRNIAAMHKGRSGCGNVAGGVEFWIEIPQRQKRGARKGKGKGFRRWMG